MSINAQAIFHDGTSDFCNPTVPEPFGKFTIRLRTAVNNVNQAFLHINGNKILMKNVKSDELFDYYESMIMVEKDTISYYFSIQDEDETFYYNRYGVWNFIDEDYNFCITPGFKTPDWAKGAVMYQIFVDRFCNGDKSNDVVDGEYVYSGGVVHTANDWYETPGSEGYKQFYGGDLQGVKDKLEYLYKLGVEVIYFNPLFVSPSSHKYDTQDYDYIDPHFGRIVVDCEEKPQPWELNNEHSKKYIKRVTNKENLEASNKFFAELVEEIHAHGMKVIIDGVFNHCGSFNKWMDKEFIYEGEDGYKHGAYVDKNSPYNKFFKFSEDHWPNNTHYDGWWGYDTLPKLNYEESKELYDYILKVAVKWVSPPYNVDGWRLDVAADLGRSEEFNHNFWKDFRKAVKEANPDAIILAEHYGDARKWLQGDEWDTVMNYDAFMEPVTWFLTGVDKHSDDSDKNRLGNEVIFAQSMTNCMSRFQTQSLQVAMNELSNHDHSRFLTRTNMRAGRLATAGAAAASEGINKAIMKEAVIMQMTWPGAPTIYYGDEAGLCGWTDPDNRRTYPWGREDLELLEFHRYTIRIHKHNKALKTGAFKALRYEKDLLVYGRFEGDNIISVIVNNSNNEREVAVPVWQLGVKDGEKMERLIITAGDRYYVGKIPFSVSDGMISVEMPAFSAAIFRKMWIFKNFYDIKYMLVLWADSRAAKGGRL
ncbi:MAG: glycoside hydrolase family 13 protein [Eubacterium sp.]